MNSQSGIDSGWLQCAEWIARPALRQGSESMPNTRVHPADVAVRNRIRVQRLLSDMSQSALGEAIGVTFQQVQKYEKGANRVGASRSEERRVGKESRSRW